MNKTIIAISASCLLAVCTQSTAAVTSTVKLASDYTFNGVSQTSNDPAL